MFLFFRKNVFLKKACFAALVFLAAMLVGCSNGTTDTPVDAQNPAISVQPSDDSWDTTTPDPFELTVTAISPDGGTLSYQWYRNTNDSSSGGIKITDATGNTLSLVGSKYPTKGDYYFYVTITNIIADNGDGGVKTKTTTSDAAKVTATNGDTYTDITMPEDMKGTWVSLWEEYIITDTEFSSSMTGFGGYSGTIENIRGKNGTDDTGYITIKYTNNDGDPGAVGKYYVIRYENLTSTTLSISGAANMNDPDFAYPKAGGKVEAGKAEAAYTLENEYFGMYSDVAKANNEGPETPVPAILIDEWSGTDDLESEHTFRITSTTLTYSMDSSPFFRANIVKVNELDDDSGYLVFQYILFNSPNKDDLVDTYCVLYYEGLTESEAKLAIFNEGSGFGDVGESTLAAAEEAYVIENDDYYDPEYDLISCTK